MSRDKTTATAVHTVNGECKHCWRPLPNEHKLRQKCDLADCDAEVVGATSSDSFSRSRFLCTPQLDESSTSRSTSVKYTSNVDVLFRIYRHIFQFSY